MDREYPADAMMQVVTNGAAKVTRIFILRSFPCRENISRFDGERSRFSICAVSH